VVGSLNRHGLHRGYLQGPQTREHFTTREWPHPTHWLWLIFPHFLKTWGTYSLLFPVWNIYTMTQTTATITTKRLHNFFVAKCCDFCECWLEVYVVWNVLQLITPEFPHCENENVINQSLPILLAEPVTASNSFVGTEEYIAPVRFYMPAPVCLTDWLMLQCEIHIRVSLACCMSKLLENNK